MLTLGFVSAILPDLTLEEVLAFAASNGFSCVELMCWPLGKAERRYAGITHIDVAGFSKSDAARVNDLAAKYGVSISGLGYYPNPLAPDKDEAKVYVKHLEHVIKAASLLGVPVVNTFVGRDYTLTIDENWPRFLKTWKPLIAFAEKHNVKIGIENCPMSFTKDEWPGGKNLMTSPAIWRRAFNDIPSDHFGLNFDPSHFILQHMDYLKAMREFGPKLFHMHAKDARIDRDKLNEVGVFAFPNQWHTPKLPGLGDVDWGKFFSVLTETGYKGGVCIEVEDRAYEGDLELRKASLIQSGRFLKNFLP
ncbi:MAG: sugar phosphate isomerase/epimerase [Bryobacterales bacterium]|nr:sugar phosphate isomerase/epimerase [Bryobacterales bacterium]